MIFPKEKATIISKIKEIGREGGSFDEMTCIHKFNAQHLSDDWEECLEELAKQGILIKKEDKYKMVWTKEAIKVYKPLVETSDGKLVSIWACAKKSGVRLEYKERRITYNPEGGMGIWVSPSLWEAESQLHHNAGYTKEKTSGIGVIHEATPLGEGMGNMEFRYPAILLGKEVWREKPREVPVTFKVGDKVRVKEGITSTMYGFADGWRSREDIGEVGEIKRENLRVKFPKASIIYTCLASEMEIVPEEELRPKPKFKVGDKVIEFGSYARGTEFIKGRVFWAKDEGIPHATSDWPYNAEGSSFNYGEDMLELAPE